MLCFKRLDILSALHGKNKQKKHEKYFLIQTRVKSLGF